MSMVGVMGAQELMPVPAKVEQGAAGAFRIDRDFAVKLEGYTEPRLERALVRFERVLGNMTGEPVRLYAAQGKTAKFVVMTKAASKPVQELGEDESYTLRVMADGVRLEAANPLGAMHGLQTFLQLVRAGQEGYEATAVTIEDKPRFPWRGLMIDSARHFMPLDVIRRNLDGMQAVKLNVFHWHLSDDQGFRVESKKYPKLHGLGSDGFFYTQDEVRQIVEYARDRGIRVVPEFDMPGHATAWFVGYPELASAPGPYAIERNWGIFDPAMDPTKESTYEFLDGLIEEMAALFPDAYFHIGGDEVNGKQWDRAPQVQAWKRQHGFTKNEQIQAEFTGRVQKIVAKHGKIMEGWDEVLQPTTPKDIVIQSWRGAKSLAQAARGGWRGVLSAGYYLDVMQPAGQHYAVDPLGGAAAALTPEQQKNILGGEACMWSEFVSWENIDQRIWTRLPAIAERLWSPKDATEQESMYARLPEVWRKLEAYGLKHATTEEMMLARMTNGVDTTALRTLGSAVEPPKEYQREELAHHDQFTPLNELVDAVAPESLPAREFSRLVDAMVQNRADGQQRARAQAMLRQWA
ncbi:MAG: family 20 glycosylhydrolase, partial [Acidobacteriales bacterium]|nr:family 20 glycosylhydrolase [Terriglobales bacterium]